MRKILRRSPIVLALLAVLAVAVVGTASATGSSAGKTVLTTNPDTTKVLVRNLIVPLPVGGAGFGVASLFPPSLKYSFPITGISGGVIGHSGGMKFVNGRNFKSATIRNFDIDTNTAEASSRRRRCRQRRRDRRPDLHERDVGDRQDQCRRGLRVERRARHFDLLGRPDARYGAGLPSGLGP